MSTSICAKLTGLHHLSVRMKNAAATVSALILLGVLCAQIRLAPYTKVEESFSLQAVHDVLTHGVLPLGRDSFDHVTFSGAVPRSFIGALLLSAVSAPFVFVCRILGGSSADCQVCVRHALALCLSWSFFHMARRFFPNAATLRAIFYCVCAAQFHITFWGSRTTPNGIALPLVNVALAEIVHGPRVYAGLVLLACTAVILRLELVCLALPAYLLAWLYRERPFLSVFFTGAVSCAVGIATSVLVDSYFWQYTVWPEGHAALFNIVQGHSAEWGVSPVWAYMSDLLRLVTTAFPFAILGLFCRTSIRLPLFALVITHVILMSCLAHKEWRFVIYVVPLINALATHAYGVCYRSRMGFVLALVSICISASFCVLGTYVSMFNYPGGEALHALHSFTSNAGVVHIDTRAAMTGVSLFGSTHLARPTTSLVPSVAPVWVYDKEENVRDSCTWDYTITEQPCSGNYKEIMPVFAYAGMRAKNVKSYVATLVSMAQMATLPSLKDILPVEITRSAQLWLCERTVPC